MTTPRLASAMATTISTGIVASLGLVAALGLWVESEHVLQRTFKVARPINTSTTEMIQKRTITRGSGQPFNSK